jgi:hypothetical protein
MPLVNIDLLEGRTNEELHLATQIEDCRAPGRRPASVLSVTRVERTLPALVRSVFTDHLIRPANLVREMVRV